MDSNSVSPRKAFTAPRRIIFVRLFQALRSRFPALCGRRKTFFSVTMCLYVLGNFLCCLRGWFGHLPLPVGPIESEGVFPKEPQ